ncbi:MAG: hypothetical protein ACFB10_15405 [Salibacteraceae bacterium]
MELDLYTADDSIEAPYLSKSFLHTLLMKRHGPYDFLNLEEASVIALNEHGIITLGRRRKATWWEKKKAPWVLPWLKYRAFNGKISHAEADAIIDRFYIRSTKVEDRERDPQLLKTALQKVEWHLKTNQSDAFDPATLHGDFELCYAFLDEAIQKGKRVLWEYA